MNNFTGFVLIGGKSSRMGADKFALNLNGETFLERAVKTLKPICGNVKIVLNQTQNIETNCEIIRDIFTERGALGGIHAALVNCETEFAVILAVDLPFVTTAAIEKLCQEILSEKEFAAIVPQQSDGRFQPLCAVYRVKDCFPKVEETLSKIESASMLDLLETIDFQTINEENLAEHENIFLNINFKCEYETIVSTENS